MKQLVERSRKFPVKPSEVTIGSIAQSSVVITDGSSESHSHIGEILQLKTPTEVINGVAKSFSIKLENLKPNTAYEKIYSVRWCNPTASLFSEYVDVPRFKTLLPRPVAIDSNKVTVTPYPDHVVIKDGTTRDLQVEEGTLKAYKVSDGTVVASSSNNTISIPDLTMETAYTDWYGIYWENSVGKTSKVTLDFTTTTAKPVDIDPSKINVEVAPYSVVIKDLTPRETSSKELTLHIYDVSTGKDINSSSTGVNSVQLTGLTPETSYDSKYGLYWTNAGGTSKRVTFTFTTAKLPKPVDIDPEKVTVEVAAGHIVITDNTPRDVKTEQSKLKGYRVSDGVVVGSSDYGGNFVWATTSGLKPNTTYSDIYGIFWSNSSGESNRVKVSFTTLSDTTKSDTTTEDTTTE